MNPYYEADGITIYHGDCLQVLRDMDAGAADVVVTDPPYGLGFPYLGYDDTRDNLRALITGFLPEARRIARRVVVLCGPTQIALYPEADWVGAVSWKTTGSHGRYGYNQWTPLLFYGADIEGFGSVNGCLKSDLIALRGGGGVAFHRGEEEKEHTCPKPITTMRAVIARYTEVGCCVLDPFTGSGTTGVACVEMGRRFVGIERGAEYADLARRRIASAAAQGRLDLGGAA